MRGSRIKRGTLAGRNTGKEGGKNVNGVLRCNSLISVLISLLSTLFPPVIQGCEEVVAGSLTVLVLLQEYVDVFLMVEGHGGLEGCRCEVLFDL